MDGNGVWRFPEGSGRQGRMERYCCNVIYGAPTTSRVKGLRWDEMRWNWFLIYFFLCFLFIRVAIGQGKVREIWFFVQGQVKVREFCKLVREILNTKEVGKSQVIFAQKYLGCSRYFVHFKCMKKLIFFLAHFAHWILLKMLVLETLCPKRL